MNDWWNVKMFAPIRTKIRECEWYRASDKRLKFNALVTTYEIVLKDATHLKVNEYRKPNRAILV